MRPRSQAQILRDHNKAQLKKEKASRIELGCLARDLANERKEELEQDRLTESERKEKLEQDRLVESERKEKLEQDRLVEEQKRKDQKGKEQTAQLVRWRQWVRNYHENLLAEGFILSDGNWCRAIDSDEDDVVRLKDAKVKELSDIPAEFQRATVRDELEKSAYIYVSWDEIKYQHSWYSRREKNLLDLGFQKRTGERWLVDWRGVFSLWATNFPAIVWGWPGASSDECLIPAAAPTDHLPYEVLDLAAVDDTLLNDKFERRRYQKDLDRLPSARLGNWKDHSQRVRRFGGEESLHVGETSSRTATLDSASWRPQWVRVVSWSAYSDTLSSSTFTWGRHPPVESWLGWNPLSLLKTPTRLDKLLSLESPARLPVGLTLSNSKAKWLLSLRGASFALWYKAHLDYEKDDGIQGYSSYAIQDKGHFYDYRLMKTLLDKIARFSRLCLRAFCWLDTILPYRRSRRAVHQSTSEVDGLLNGQPVTAFFDSGSDLNLLSPSCATKHAIKINLDDIRHIKSADGREIPTSGSAEVSWSVGDSPHDEKKLVFHILDQCVHDVVLGYPSLDDTKTIGLNPITVSAIGVTSNSAGTAYDIPAASSLRLGQCSIKGRLAGEEVRALGDTGAQVNIISLKSAQEMRLKLDITGIRGTFRFIDGSEAPSIATARAVWISSNNKQHSLEFEVLIGSSHDVILGQKYVYGTKALLRQKSDPSARPSSSQRASSIAPKASPAEPPRLPLPSHNIEGPKITPPDVGKSKVADVCAVGYRDPLGISRFIPKKRDKNPPRHRSSQVQEDIDRLAAEEHRLYGVAHSGSVPRSGALEAARNSTDSTPAASISNNSPPIAPIRTSGVSEPIFTPHPHEVALKDLTTQNWQVNNADLDDICLLELNPWIPETL